MIDRLQNNAALNSLTSSLNDLDQTADVKQAEGIGAANKANNSAAGLFAIEDNATVSEGARKRLEADQYAKRLTLSPFEASQRVVMLKNLVDNGRISEYLNQLSDESLADKLLSSPVAAFLR